MKSVIEGETDTERARLLAAQARLARMRDLTWWMDSAIGIPFTRFRFGLQPIIGLVPVLGDLIGLLITLYVIVQATLVGAPRPMIGRMVGIALLDFVIGLLPVVGDAADAVFKANTRNMAALDAYLEQQLSPPEPPPSVWRKWWWVVGIPGAVLLVLAVLATRGA